MASISKRIGPQGVRWEVRIRKAGFRTLTKTFYLKVDADTVGLPGHSGRAKLSPALPRSTAIVRQRVVVSLLIEEVWQNMWWLGSPTLRSGTGSNDETLEMLVR